MGRGSVYPMGVGGSFTANIVDVEVDPHTGKVQVLRVTAFQDAGKDPVHGSYFEDHSGLPGAGISLPGLLFAHHAQSTDWRAIGILVSV